MIHLSSPSSAAVAARGARRFALCTAFSLAVFSLAVLAGGRLDAQFQEPVAISGDPAETGPLAGFALGLDHFNNALLAVVEGERLTLHEVSGNTRTSAPVPVPGGAPREPHLGFSSLRTFIVYTDKTPLETGRDREVFLVRKTGGQMTAPEAFSATVGADLTPRVAADARGEPAIVWARDLGEEGLEIILRQAGRVPVFLGPGSEPRVRADSSGRLHVAFLDGAGDLVHRSVRPGPGAGLNEVTPKRLVAPAAEIADGFHEMIHCGDGEVSIAYSTASGVRIAPVRDGVPGPARGGLTDGEARSPSLSCNAGGLLTIAWEAGGDIWYRVGSVDVLLPAERIHATPELEATPQIVADAFVNVYACFVRDERLYFVSNAELPRARFGAAPSEGESPLRVEFRDQSEGNVFRWHWEFGDGEVSGLQNPTHVYEQPGIYAVKLVVEGPGGVGSVVGEKEIRVLDPFNTMGLADRRVYSGQRDVWVPITVRHTQPMQGCQIAFSYDPAILELDRIVIDELSNFAEVAPELIIHDYSEGEDGRAVVTTAVIVDFDVPHDGRTFRAGNGQRLGSIVFHVHRSAPYGTRSVVRLQNQLGAPPINNIFIIGSSSVLPRLRSSTIVVEEPPFPPPRFFLRGDADDSQKVLINDPIVILNFLFIGGPPPACLDAADADDSGDLNITDAISVLAYLFMGGNYLPSPFPDLGLDPTADAVGDCSR